MAPHPAPPPLHATAPAAGSPALLVVLGLAGAGGAVLLGLALAALLRRGTTSYWLVFGAIAALVARTAVAVATAMGRLGGADHHLLEHGLDLVMVALVIAAVVYARRAPEREGSIG